MIFQPREFFWSHFWHFFTFFSGRPSWKIAIFSGSSFYMAERHFSHLVSHLPIGFKHIFHLLLTFVSFCPYRISTLFSHHSLKITLPLLTKSISHPPAHEFRETKKNLSKRQWVYLWSKIGAMSCPKMNFARAYKRWELGGLRPPVPSTLLFWTN